MFANVWFLQWISEKVLKIDSSISSKFAFFTQMMASKKMKLFVWLGFLLPLPAFCQPVATRILDFVKLHEGKKVGSGECADLAAMALQHAGAPIPGNYIWGTPVTDFMQNARPGDVLQFRNVLLVHEIDGGIMKETMALHTAIITDVLGPGHFQIAHQNVSGKRKTIYTTLDLNNLKRGKVLCYRPIENFSEQPSAAVSKLNGYIFLSENCPISRSITAELRKVANHQYEGTIEWLLIFPMKTSDSTSVKAFLTKYGLSSMPFQLDQAHLYVDRFDATVVPSVFIMNETPDPQKPEIIRAQLMYSGRIDDSYERVGTRRRTGIERTLHLALEHIFKNDAPYDVDAPPVGCLITR
jgi:hypothetical protein